VEESCILPSLGSIRAFLQSHRYLPICLLLCRTPVTCRQRYLERSHPEANLCGRTDYPAENRKRLSNYFLCRVLPLVRLIIPLLPSPRPLRLMVLPNHPYLNPNLINLHYLMIIYSITR